MHYNQINEAMNCTKSINDNLYVGLCGTSYVGSDRYAVVITEIVSPKCVRVAYMDRTDYNDGVLPLDENGNQFLKNMKNYVQVSKDRTKLEAKGKLYKLRKNARWIQEGQSLWSTGAVHFGEADEYRDPSF